MRKSKLLFPCLLLGAMALTSSASFADGPRDFLQKALEGDNSEIVLGRMASDRARDPGVREFGRTLARDHSDARDDVLRVGRRMGLRPQRDVSPEARDERERLSQMGGREFDREFIRYMTDDHRKDLSEFNDEARERHGPVSDLARRQIPTLQKHLDIAMSLDRHDDHRGFDDHHGRNDDRDRRDGRDMRDR